MGGHLFQYKDLAKWLDEPFATPPGLSDHPQARLPGFDLGQLPKVTAVDA